MNSQDILLLNIVGACGFLVWYAVSRGGGRKPTRLDMKAGESSRATQAQNNKSLKPKGEKVPSAIDKEPVLETLPEELNHFSSSDISGMGKFSYKPHGTKEKREIPTEKVLNVMFAYNAHTWDAYEVLGIPAGSSIVKVTEAYQNAIRNCDKESIPFLEAAYQAILKKVG